MSGLVSRTGEETPTLLDIILNAIRTNQLELNTVMPGTIVSYDSSKQTATVQPSFRRSFIEPLEVVSRPEIDDVPLVFPRSGQAGIVFPVNAGDSVLLLFSQRSLDDWAESGGEVQVSDSRLHDINDCIALAGFASLAEKLDPAPLDGVTEVRGEKVFVGDPAKSESSTPAPEGNLDGVDVLSLLNKTLYQLTLLTVPTAVGPSGVPINASEFESIRTDLKEILRSS